MKKLMIYSSAAITLCASLTAKADGGGTESPYILVSYNVAAMTLTKLARANNKEICEAAKLNFEKEFPDRTRLTFKCIPVPKFTL